MSNCTYYYKYKYDKELTRFDAIDMNGFSDGNTICNSLFNLVNTLVINHRNTLSEVIRYSYLFSMQFFIDSSVSIDYGGCDNLSAVEPTFCLDYYDWNSRFSLWSYSEVKLICGRVATTLQESVQSDPCAFITESAYEAYGYYENRVLDSMVSYKM